MSRLIVKNLPKTITDEKLKDYFGQRGVITDIQLKYTKEGVFRRFAFVGYQKDDEAAAALQYFNNSFIQTSKIKVELCAPLGAQDKPKSWSKYSSDSNAFRKIHGREEDEQSSKQAILQLEKKKIKKKKDFIDDIIGEHKNDPEFVEFMQAHSKDNNLWANDTAVLPNEGSEVAVQKDSISTVISNSLTSDLNVAKSKDESEENEQTLEKLAEKEISDKDYMKSLMKKSNESKADGKKLEKTQLKADLELFTIKIQNLPFKVKRQDIIKFFKPLKPYSVRLPSQIHGFCYVGFRTEKEFIRGMQKDKSFIKGKQVFFSDFTEKNKITKSKLQQSCNGVNDRSSSNKNTKWSKQEESIRNEEDISESGKIFFRNLAYTINEAELNSLFEKYGQVAELNLPIDPLTRKIKGFGTVTFVMPEHAVQAFNELDGTLFHGRLLHLIPGKSTEVATDPNDEGLNFKEKKALKLKKLASSSHNWNTLFLGANAVADSLAKRFETSKETILDANSGGSSAAVRLALGETQLVIEMKKFLEENDVKLSVFDSAPTKRSKTVIVAKNLPAETTVSELKPLFKKFGLLGRIVLPPSGVSAIIEFLDPSEARCAFSNLAYSKFKNLPLYLEWAPENVFTTTPDISTGKFEENVKAEKEEVESAIKCDKKSGIAVKLESQTETADVNMNENEIPEPNTTLFLRNLNFRTHEDAIRSHFKNLGAIHIIQVARRKDPDDPKNKISLGYGFIQFMKAKDAEKVLKDMQFTKIEGNQVELKRSDRILKGQEQHNSRKNVKTTKQTGSKILVRNVPFQAKQNEVRDIFKTFGELKSVRLPKKMTPGEDSHRGFGFVDFLTKDSAKTAFDALCASTHLYGRRLVLEWADADDENIDQLRKRTAENYYQSKTKRSRKSVFDASTIGSGVTNESDEEH